MNVQREDYENKGFDVREGRNSDKREREQWVGRNYSPHFPKTPVRSQAFGGGKNFDEISQKILMTASGDHQKKEGSERKTWAARGRGGVQSLESGDLTKQPERLRGTSKYFERKGRDYDKEEIKTKMTYILSKLQLQELDEEKGSFRKRLQGARLPIQPSSRSLLAGPSSACRTSRTFSATSTRSTRSTMGSATNASSPPFQVIHTSPNGRRARSTFEQTVADDVLEQTMAQFGFRPRLLDLAQGSVQPIPLSTDSKGLAKGAGLQPSSFDRKAKPKFPRGSAPFTAFSSPSTTLQSIFHSGKGQNSRELKMTNEKKKNRRKNFKVAGVSLPHSEREPTDEEKSRDHLDAVKPFPPTSLSHSPSFQNASVHNTSGVIRDKRQGKQSIGLSEKPQNRHEDSDEEERNRRKSNCDILIFGVYRLLGGDTSIGC